MGYADTHAGVRITHRCLCRLGLFRGGLCRGYQMGSEAGVGSAGWVEADPLHLWVEAGR